MQQTMATEALLTPVDPVHSQMQGKPLRILRSQLLLALVLPKVSDSGAFREYALSPNLTVQHLAGQDVARGLARIQ